MNDVVQETRQKALLVNLNEAPYGSFAEIGAGNPSDGHGWTGIRFQARLRDEPSEIIVHVHLMDKSTHTPEVLSRIREGDPSWEAMVPPKVAEIIRAKKLFGFRPAP